MTNVSKILLSIIVALGALFAYQTNTFGLQDSIDSTVSKKIASVYNKNKNFDIDNGEAQSDSENENSDDYASGNSSEKEDDVNSSSSNSRNFSDKDIYVYESPADSKEDCTSYEKFNSKNHTCYLECSTEKECTQMQSDIENELDNWTDEYKGKSADEQPASGGSYEDEANEKTILAKYKVFAGENISLVNGKDDSEYHTLWSQIAALSPDDISNKYIEEYDIFNNKNSDVLAFVDDVDNNSKWRVAINLPQHKASKIEEQKATIIHELFHILSLNRSQVDPNVSKCNNFSLDEGCANSNSYINLFKNKFWKGVSSQDYSSSKFVTEYAASNEVEDLAESFTFFVLSKDKDSLGNTIKDNKLKFFYDFPELVSLRTNMRNTLGQDIIRARRGE